MDLFSLTRPQSAETPVLVEVPHAGLGLPDAVRGQLQVDREVILRDSDLYVDRLVAGAPKAGASLLCAHVSRYVVDLNRAADDVDEHTVIGHPETPVSQPRGVVWRLTTEGRQALSAPLTVDQLHARLREFHAPYHEALQHELERKRRVFGFAILLAAHSMPSVSRRVGRPERRADIVPGTRGRSTASTAVIDCVDRFFRGRGRSVQHDHPYRGGYSTGRYGRPGEHWHSIQLELNRALYADESTARPLDGPFEALSSELTELVAELGRLKLR